MLGSSPIPFPHWCCRFPRALTRSMQQPCRPGSGHSQYTILATVRQSSVGVRALLPREELVLRVARITLLLFMTGWLAAQTPRPPPPPRDPHPPGYVAAKALSEGEHAPADQDGNFILGPTHSPSREAIVQEDVPHGTVDEFTMASSDSKFYPGIARDPHTFGTPDPSNHARLLVPTSH